MKDYSTEILGMEEAVIEEFEESKTEIRLKFSQLRRKHICPACGAETEKVHDYRIRILRDTQLRGKKLTLEYRRRRYLCTACGCRFPEKCAFAGRYQRITYRATESIIEALHFRHSLKDIARQTAASASVVRRTLDRICVDPPKTLPESISFDEFRGNTGGEKFQCIVTDPMKRRLFDILPARNVETIQDYLLRFPNRMQVKVAVMDMNRGFLNVARTFLPNAKIVIDRFHVVRLCTEAFERVRKDVQKKLPKVQRKYFKHSRRLLLKHRSDLKQEERDAVDVMLRFDESLLKAYALKEAFYHFMASTDRNVASCRLDFWLDSCLMLDLPAFKTCRSTFRYWRAYILNAFDVPASNGFTEGCNNAIKVLKRVAFGFRSFVSFRKRILLAASSHPYI